MGQGVRSEATLGLSEEEITGSATEDESIIETEDSGEPESVEESVKEALAEVKAGQGEGSEDEEAGEPASHESGQSAKHSQQAQDGKPSSVAAPNRFSADTKEAWEKFPPEIQAEAARMFREHQGRFTQGQQQLAQAEKEARHLVEAVRPYYTSNPELAEAGISESALVAQLIGNHQLLMNPETSASTLTRIGKSLGFDVELSRDGSTVSASQNGASFENNPQFQSLQQQNSQILSWIEQRQVQEAAQPILEEINEVQDEVDASGNFLYPETHKREFLQYAKPLVSELKRTHPGISYGEALKHVVQQARQSFGYSPQASSTGLPVKNNQKAVSAAKTVRGRVAPSAEAPRDPLEVPQNETPEQSAKIALEDLLRGR